MWKPNLRATMILSDCLCACKQSVGGILLHRMDLIIKLVLFLEAVFFPLYAVDFMRLHLGRNTLAIPMVLTGLLIVIWIFGAFTYSNIRSCILGRYKNIFLLTLFFLLWHLISLREAQNISVALVELLKLTTGVVVFWGIIIVFPRDKVFLERFWTVVIWCSVVLMSYLVYQYAVVFKMPFLNKFLILNSDPIIARMGKNHPAWYLAVVVPYAIFYCWHLRYRWFSWVPSFVLIFSLLYMQSRGSWIALLAGISYVSVHLFRMDKKALFKMCYMGILGLMVFVLIMGTVIVQFVDLSEIPIRILSIIHPQAIPEGMSYLGKHSYVVRGEIIMDALKEFKASPITGIGIANATFGTHNDLVGILLELGFIGGILFLGILYAFLRKTGFSKDFRINQMNWLSFASRASLVSLVVSTLFLNSYLSPFFWSICSLYIVVRELELHNDGEVEKKCLD